MRDRACAGKAIWVIAGDDVTVENITFSGARVPDQNGAGIRAEGKNLTVRSSRFYDNENGILAARSGSTILIQGSLPSAMANAPPTAPMAFTSIRSRA